MDDIGHYTTIEKIAYGAESVLYRAIDGNGRELCIKEIRRTCFRDVYHRKQVRRHAKRHEERKRISYSKKREHLQNEFNVGQTFKEAPFIVTMYGLRKVTAFGGFIESGYDLIMEYIAGDDFGDRNFRQSLALVHKLSFLLQAAQAFQYMHKRRYVHQDVKPSNIMVSEGLVKIIDFGITTTGGSKSDSTKGTKGYMSPEQIINGAIVDEYTDVFGFGVAMYVLLGGHPLQQKMDDLGSKEIQRAARDAAKRTDPMVRPNPGKVKNADLRELIEICTIPKISDRIQNMGVVIRALESIAKAEGFAVDFI